MPETFIAVKFSDKNYVYANVSRIVETRAIYSPLQTYEKELRWVGKSILVFVYKNVHWHMSASLERKRRMPNIPITHFIFAYKCERMC